MQSWRGRAAAKGLGSFVLAALVAAAPSAWAQVAEVHPLRGEILVQTGSGYKAIQGAVEVRPGDAAIAAPDAIARLVYADGCSVDVVPGSIAWVRARSPCQAASGPPPARDPDPKLVPRAVFDPAWLTDGVAQIDVRKPPAGP